MCKYEDCFNVANEYTIRNTRGTLLTTITPGTKDDSTSLVLQGRGMLEYGLDRDQNLVFLLENFSNTTAPSNPIDGQFWWKTGQELFVWDTQAGSPGLWEPIIPPPQILGFTVEAGDGLIGGGFPTLSPLETTLHVGAGAGIVVTADLVSTDDSAIDHDALSESVGSPVTFANEHIDHSLVIVTAGAGFTAPSGGDITATRNFDIGEGDGITVNADDVAVDSTVVRVGSPEQTIAGIKTWTIGMDGVGSVTTAPTYSFSSAPTTGIYHSASNELTIVTGGKDRITIDSSGAMNVPGSPMYETLVTEDDDIPNKKYVDDAMASGVAPTSNTFVGVDSIGSPGGPPLDGAQTYLVTAYGVLPNKGTLLNNLNAIVVRSGTTLGGGSILTIAGGGGTIDWFDGGGPTHSSLIVSMAGSKGINCAVNNDGFGLWGSTLLQAIQLTNN